LGKRERTVELGCRKLALGWPPIFHLWPMLLLLHRPALHAISPSLPSSPTALFHGAIPHHSVIFAAAVRLEEFRYHQSRAAADPGNSRQHPACLSISLRAGLHHRWRAWHRVRTALSTTGYLGQARTDLESKMDEMKDSVVCSSSGTLEPHAW